jgi:hypothetical protein
VIRALLCIVFSVGIAAAAFAVDFGLNINQTPEYGVDAGGKVFTYTGSYLPWFSASFSEKTSLYVSARLGTESIYRASRWEHDVSFELDRMEINVRPRETVYLSFGRQRYQDSAGMVASGNFDGVQGTFGLGWARVTGGIFYTGLLDKKTTEILLTWQDLEDYQDSGEHFASRRLIMAAGGEFPDLTSRTSLAVSALAQFDLNGHGKSGLHSQYAEARYGLDVTNTLRFTLTGIAGLMESGGEGRGNLAAVLAADWELPGRLADMLSGELRWGSGSVNRAIGPFLPVTGIAQGRVFTPTLPGLMKGGISYAARPSSALSLSAAGTFFFRTDLETLADPELDSTSKDRFLGVEFYGQLVWAPQSALRVTAGGGFFLPQGAFVNSADPRWKINAGLVLSL